MHSTVITSFDTPARDTSVGQARRTLLTDLACLNLTPDQAHAVRLCVSEIVTNALRHGVGGEDSHETLRVEAAADRTRGVLRVTVTDPSRTNSTPTIRPTAAPDAESGRGLSLVDSLADAMGWGERRGADGKRRRDVWFELEVSLAGLPVAPAAAEEPVPEPRDGRTTVASRIALLRAATLLPAMAPGIRVGAIRPPRARAAPRKRAA
ncbi:ATP-binding protein [Kitasatospora sp. NPDC048545]|uniref:ATP-binding protein n=1 Tax=Kitasatospora sp. NPDC048545 TaxID=3157208 RepID=UPI0033C811A1